MDNPANPDDEPLQWVMSQLDDARRWCSEQPTQFLNPDGSPITYEGQP